MSGGRRGGRPGRLAGRSAFVVACEGETEVADLDALRRHIRLSSKLAVIQRAKGSDPKSVVRHAARVRDEMRSTAQRGEGIRPDLACAVVDSEGPHPRPGLAEARELARRCGIRLLVSTPCVELWLILHIVEWTRALLDAGQAERELRRLLPEYKKVTVPFERLRDAVQDAVDRAKDLRMRAAETGNLNPSTDLFELVERMLRDDRLE